MNKDLFLKQLEIMLNLQDKINTKINKDWRNANNPWYRAIWVESAELLDHIGWKWWKKQNLDMQQVKLELIDIWHFGLSDLLQKQENIESIISKIDSIDLSTDILSDHNILLTKVENFAKQTLETKSFDLIDFLKLTIYFKIDLNEIYKIYLGKNILNIFRQDHGYKEGTYIKTWNNREDNEWLSDIIDSQFNHTNHAMLTEYIYNELEKIYITILK